FGTSNGGQQVTTARFRAHAEKAAGKSLADFFARWLEQPGLDDRRSGPFSVLSFWPEGAEAGIVYGTSAHGAVNRPAATDLAKVRRRRGHNVDVPVRSDKDVSEADLKGRHVLLVGRPSTNRITAKFAEGLPVRFGPRSVKVREQVYAHPDTAVLA